MLLAGDIGGTNCRLALFERENSRIRLVETADFASNQYASLGEVVKLFLGEHGVDSVIENAAFGVAGPVDDGRRVQATNLPWVVDSAILSGILKTPKVILMNDLVANAYGTFLMTESDYVTLNSGVARTGANMALISAGTGLGEAGLVCVGGQYSAVASEGGHCSFAPQREIEFKLLCYLQKKFGHVSWERVISGGGLLNIYNFLCEQGGQSQSIDTLAGYPELDDLDPSAKISKAAILGIDQIAEQSLDLFVGFYGAEAGNVALKFLATSAVYIGGGIAPKILPKLLAGSFFEAFVAKGRFDRILQEIPIRVILNDRTALLGAALIAARQAGFDVKDPPVMEINQ